ncbi:MAG: SGNH/GDSL hydrolase family protein [Elusimicrobia bacterium]|nr:SGNH/GDSL hydrolase family protein [Elusimicrobiota bacterium]
MAKAAALLLIVALGDSTTAGTPYFRSPVEAPPSGSGDPAGSWTYWLGRAKPSWRVLNAGVNGERTDQIAARLERDALAHGPRYVVVLGGVNDAFQGAGPAAPREALTEIYRRVRGAGAIPVAATVLPFDRAAPEQAAAIRELNAWIRAEAKRLKLPLADTAAAARHPREPGRLRGSPDGLHPDIRTARRVADAVRRAIEKAEED